MEKKCIVIRYLKHSKDYVFIETYEVAIAREIKSWNAEFLEEIFPYKREISQDLDLLEMAESVPGGPVEYEDQDSTLLRDDRRCVPMIDLVPSS